MLLKCALIVKVLVLSRVWLLVTPMDRSPPGFSVHRVLQARILEWAAFPSTGNLPNRGIKTRFPALQVDSLPSEPPGKPQQICKPQQWPQDFADKGLSSQSYGFSSSCVWMWELDYKEGSAPKNWCFQIVMLKKTLESLLNSIEIKPVHPKGNQPWIFIGRTDAEVPILWPPDSKSRLIGKDPDAGKDWGQEEMRVTRDGWVASSTLWTEFEQVPEDGEGQGSLVCCSPWGGKESDMTE